MKRRAALLALLAAVVLAAICAGGDTASARPGGGGGFSGGGGHGDSDGGGGVAIALELIFHLIRLCFYYPAIGLPILGIVIAFFIYSAWKKHQDKDWDSGPPVQLHAGDATRLDRIRAIDPEFSIVLFEDFCYRLYATAHRARSRPTEMEGLAPYLSDVARRSLLERPPQAEPVDNVIVGAMRPFRVDVPSGPFDEQGNPTFTRVALEFETNYSVGAPGAQRTFYVVENWLLRRAAGALTKKPAGANRFPCPNCGANFQSSDGARCDYCNEVVDNGRFDWQVEQIILRHSADKGPTLTGQVKERGTNLPTYEQDGFDMRWLQLQQEDPSLTDAAILARLGLIYRELNQAWTTNDLRPVRGLISDGMYDYLQYWVDAYRAQGLRNVLEGMHITHTDFAKLARDRHYDALTIRLWGTGHDYTIREATGEVVAGSRGKDRKYSEYWTLIRSATRRGPVGTEPQCPSCGAPLQINMAGSCEFCNAHLTAGEFDWVLSKIEQDDTYRG